MTTFIRKIYMEDNSLELKQRRLDWDDQIEIKDVKVPSFLAKCIPPKGPRKLVRCENLNYMRNNLQHKGSTTLDKEEFEKYWNDTKGILKDLGLEDIDNICEGIFGTKDSSLEEKEKQMRQLLVEMSKLEQKMLELSEQLQKQQALSAQELLGKGVQKVVEDCSRTLMDLWSIGVRSVEDVVKAIVTPKTDQADDRRCASEGDAAAEAEEREGRAGRGGSDPSPGLRRNLDRADFAN